MRHQPRLIADRLEELAIRLHGIDRRQPQPRQLRHMFKNLLDQRAKLWRAGKIGAVARDVDAGERDLAITVGNEPAHVLDHRSHRHRARIAATEWNDAKRATMIAAILYLHEGPRAPGECIDQVWRGLRYRHDVVDDRFRR